MRARLEFKKQDLWIGAYWSSEWYPEAGNEEKDIRQDVWICIVPMFPIHIWWWRS